MAENNWQIEMTDRYYYRSGRNYDTYMEVTFYYCTITGNRMEKTRSQEILYNRQDQLEDWAKSITEHRKKLDML